MIRAVYYFEDTLHEAGPAGGRELLAQAAEIGFTAVVTEPVRLPEWLIPVARELGLKTFVGVACFSDHADPVLPERPHLWPVEASGRRRPRQEWYTGLIPTDEEHNAGIVARCAELVEQGADGVIADFIRWPMHWELELRAPERHQETSFDPITLAGFAAWAGITLPDDPASAAAVIHGQHAESWYAFRRSVVTDVLRRIAVAVRAVDPDALVGAFVVPATEAQRLTWLGQDVAAFAEHCDALFPMAYHAMTHRPPSWVAEVTQEIAAASGGVVVPVVQCTADPAVSDGADWGHRFDADEFAEVLAQTADAPGVVVFCGEGLTPDRARVVARSFGRADLPALSERRGKESFDSRLSLRSKDLA
ncbi:hypothetical protein [Actinokineospora sp. HUAS TT18]|uniref:hypothetical protein n=1 Tax=Actinokineospora sp. HUAS TT18 TaxID=3447451 RepID=UPI003F528C4F